jgi:putative Mg2+ transporter-C (MgtC) family protein
MGDTVFPDSTQLTDADYLIALCIAVALGALIGLERRLRGHEGGMHLNALVSLGSAAYVIAGTLFNDDPTAPGRVAGQVVTGVGFLCAGFVFRQGSAVRGINTAATVWCSAAVGVLCGMSLTLWGIIVAVLVLLTNVILHFVEHRLVRPNPPAE